MNRTPLYVRISLIAAALLALALLGGCATVRTTDPQRTATEQFLMTEAVTRAVDQLSATALRDKLVFVDSTYIWSFEGPFLVAQVHARLLAAGARLVAKREDAKVIVEIRSGGVGIDRYDYLLGIPSIVLPSNATGSGTIPLITPELAILKTLKQRGYASVAIVAYWADTGELIASSGPFIGRTLREDYWLFGGGPRTVGNIPPVESPK